METRLTRTPIPRAFRTPLALAMLVDSSYVGSRKSHLHLRHMRPVGVSCTCPDLWNEVHCDDDFRDPAAIIHRNDRLDRLTAKSSRPALYSSGSRVVRTVVESTKANE